MVEGKQDVEGGMSKSGYLRRALRYIRARHVLEAPPIQGLPLTNVRLCSQPRPGGRKHRRFERGY